MKVIRRIVTIRIVAWIGLAFVVALRCCAQGSHIVADPVYAPSSGYNKTLLLLLHAYEFQ